MTKEQILQLLDSLRNELELARPAPDSKLESALKYVFVFAAEIKRSPEFFNPKLLKTCWEFLLSNKSDPILERWLKANGRTVVKYLMAIQSGRKSQ